MHNGKKHPPIVGTDQNQSVLKQGKKQSWNSKMWEIVTNPGQAMSWWATHDHTSLPDNFSTRDMSDQNIGNAGSHGEGVDAVINMVNPFAYADMIYSYSKDVKDEGLTPTNLAQGAFMLAFRKKFPKLKGKDLKKKGLAAWNKVKNKVHKATGPNKTKVKPNTKTNTKTPVVTKKNELIHIPKERGVSVIPKGKDVIPGPVKPKGWINRNLWEGNRKWWTIGAGAFGAGSAGYEDWKENQEENQRQNYIEVNPEVNESGSRRYESGGVAPNMENVQNAVMNGESVALPGGSASPIAEGSNAIEYSGQTHEEDGSGNSGILVDNAEVENGETQDQVTMRKGGKKKDYFFSNHLQKGGIPISEWHKQIVQNGDSQQAKDALAREQEIIAGRNPEVVAKNGGFKAYATGGQKNPWDIDYNFSTEEDDPANLKDMDGDGVPDHKDDDIDGDGVPNLIDKENVVTAEEKKEAKTNSPHKSSDRFTAFGENYSKIEEANTQAGYTGGGEDGSYRADDLGDEGIAGIQKGAGKGYYGEVNESNMTDFYNRNSSLMKEMGINSPDEFDPDKHTKQFQEKFNSNLSSTYDNDPELQAKLEEAGIDKDAYIQQSGFHGSGATGIDGKMGEFTWSKTSMGKKSKPDEEEIKIDEEIIEETNIDQTTTTTSGRKRWGDGVDLSMLQFLPAAVAMTDKPDYMDNPDVIVPATVRAERIKADKIGMVNFNAERAAIDMDAANMDQFIQNSGGGMSNISNKMANQTSKFKARMAINAQESKKNVEIEGENVANKLNADATNQTKALEASTKNQAAQGSADELNTKNKMYVDEFNRGADAATFDRKLNALDTMTQGAMTMQMAREKNATDLEIANVYDGDRDAWERYQGEETTTTSTKTDVPKYTDAEKHLRELLKKQGVKEGSDEWKKYIT